MDAHNIILRSFDVHGISPDENGSPAGLGKWSDILFSENIKWGDNDLKSILWLKQEGHPEGQCFAHFCACNADNILVTIQYCLDNLELPPHEYNKSEIYMKENG